MFEIFKRNKSKKPANWKDLSNKQKQLVTRQLIKAMAGSRYKVVSGFDEFQREQGITEHKDEDQILNAYQRGRMLSLTRNAARNSPTLNGILKQFDLNAVGTEGGKAIINFDDIKLAKDMKSKFAMWTRSADFFDGLSLNTTLKLILKTYILGGDMVILFDDGLIEDSGKLLVYEPDEIGNTTDEALAKHYGKFARQSHGRVYNANGRFVGAIVSRSQRGIDVFDPTKSFFLHQDPDATMFDSKWMMPRNVFRFAQGRGISPMSSSLATVLDLEDLCGFELAAAKKNSQTIATIIQNASQVLDEGSLPSAFDTNTDFEGMTDEEIEAAVKEEADTKPVTMTLDKVKAAGVIYQVLPENFKMELLDTKHPNQAVPEFINFLAGRTAAPFGLSNQYATLVANGADFRAGQLMTQPAFDECQKFLEQICDWTIFRWANWAAKKNMIDYTKLDADWISQIKWSWTKAADIDEHQHQVAVEMKLRNLTGTLREELGPDWKEKLEQMKEEIQYCKDNKLPHPAWNLKSGGERSDLQEQYEE